MRAYTASAMVLAVVSALAPSMARGDAIMADLPHRVGQDVREEILGNHNSTSPDLFDYGGLARSFMISILGKPVLFTEEDIDRIVGDPWRLNDATRVKLDALPPRLRLRLYSVLAAHADSIVLQPPHRLGLTPVNDFRPVGLVMDEATRSAELDGIGKALDGYFRTEELIDLVVYGLSKMAFFPKTQEGWSELKLKLPHYDLALGLAGLAGLASVEQANLDVGGWVVKAPDDVFRGGWFVSAKHVGVKWHPHFIAGVQGATPGLDASLGWVEYFNPETPSEIRSIELTVREHYFTRLVSRNYHWETSAVGVLGFVWEHTDPTKEKTFRGQVEFYARRPAIFEDPQVDFLLEGALGTDFRHGHASDLSVGLELPTQAIAGAVRFTSNTDPVFPTEWHIGLVFGGSIGEHDGVDYYREVEELGQRVREALAYFKAVEDRFCATDERTRTDPESRAAAEELRVATVWIDQATEILKREATNYAHARRRCVAHLTRALVGAATEEEAAAAELLPGPVTLEEAQFIRSRSVHAPGLPVCEGR